MLDNLINTYFQKAKDFFQPPVDQESLWYGQRPVGEDYMPPFSYRTPFNCQGLVQDMPEEQQEETDFYLVLSERFPLSMAATKQPGHKDGDFSDFMIQDFQKYDF